MFYSDRERKAVLKSLHINPDAERVNSSEAGKILTWRAKQEHGVDLQYDATSVRKHAKKLDAQSAVRPDGTVNKRQNTYNARKLFEIDLMPTRTNRGVIAQREKQERQSQS